MSTSDSCKDGASISNDDGLCDVNDMLQNMSTADDDVSVCANCGKEGSDINNVCNKCKQVRYCNAACKKKHRHKHKKDCDEHCRHAAELHDNKLFKQPPPQYGDCPICFLRLPTYHMGRNYMTCCGRVICSGCIYAIDEIDEEEKCPFCRVPAPETDEEIVERDKKRVEAGDANAIYDLGLCYRDGEDGYPKDHKKSLELLLRSAELGYASAYNGIGNAYEFGRGVEIDMKTAVHYYELAAMRGDSMARKNLGVIEEEEGNIDRSIKHFMIAAKSGHNESMDQIKRVYSNGEATKDDYTRALQLYQEYLVEIKSVQRDKAASAYDDYRYY